MASMISIRPRPMLLGTPFASAPSVMRRNKSQFPSVHHSPSLITGQSSPRRGLDSKLCACGDYSSVPSRKNIEDHRYKFLLAGKSFALACAPGAIARCSTKKRKTTRVVAVLSSGQQALQSLLDMTVALSSSPVEEDLPPVLNSELLKNPSTAYIKETIKKRAIWLMRKGKPEEAVEFLQGLCGNCSYSPAPAYELGMALVEVLICQEKYEAALCELMKCDLKDPQGFPSEDFPSDARIPLYKAIIHTMLDEVEAKEWWKDYIRAFKEGLNPPSH